MDSATAKAEAIKWLNTLNFKKDRSEDEITAVLNSKPPAAFVEFLTSDEAKAVPLKIAIEFVQPATLIASGKETLEYLANNGVDFTSASDYITAAKGK